MRHLDETLAYAEVSRHFKRARSTRRRLIIEGEAGITSRARKPGKAIGRSVERFYLRKCRFDGIMLSNARLSANIGDAT